MAAKAKNMVAKAKKSISIAIKHLKRCNKADVYKSPTVSAGTAELVISSADVPSDSKVEDRAVWLHRPAGNLYFNMTGAPRDVAKLYELLQEKKEPKTEEDRLPQPLGKVCFTINGSPADLHKILRGEEKKPEKGFLSNVKAFGGKVAMAGIMEIVKEVWRVAMRSL